MGLICITFESAPTYALFLVFIPGSHALRGNRWSGRSAAWSRIAGYPLEWAQVWRDVRGLSVSTHRVEARDQMICGYVALKPSNTMYYNAGMFGDAL